MRVFRFLAPAVTGLLLLPNLAFAAGTGGLKAIISDITSTIADVPTLVAGIFFITGIAFVGSGLLALKRHGDDPDRYPQGKAWWSLGAGGALCAVTLIAGALTATAGSGGNDLQFKAPPPIKAGN